MNTAKLGFANHMAAEQLVEGDVFPIGGQGELRGHARVCDVINRDEDNIYVAVAISRSHVFDYVENPETMDELESPDTVWGVYKNTDMTEGKGIEYLDRIFRTKAAAVRWQRRQSDYPGWPMHKVKKVKFDQDLLSSEEGMEWPR